ncbi:MAG: L-2-hydroxyglutarate oxidase [Gammaproteobacteria bacterium]
MSRAFDFLVVGAGIVGLATAAELQRRRPGARVAVIDKEAAVARHQTGHNSGVIHAGVYYAPDSLKARYCRAGLRATFEFCAAHDIPHRRCGKLIVATDARDEARLRDLAARAAHNGLTLEWLDRAGIAAREPRVRGVAALFVAETGIADYPALCAALANEIRARDGELLLGHEVLAIQERADEAVIETTQGALRGARLVVCGGLQADRLARLAGLEVALAIVPFRGDYFTLPAARSALVSTLIYPVPDPALPFLGVHLTLTADGGLTLGPSAMLALAREIYRPWAWQARDALEALRYAGTWRLLARYPRAGVAELLHAASRRAYLAAARRYCPELTLDDLATWSCGIRAQAVSPAGELIHDFAFAGTARSVHVLNAPSPAATAAFPIAEAVVTRLLGEAQA